MAHEPLRSASVTRRGVESDSSRQIGTGSTRASWAWATRSAGGSGCSMHSTSNSASRLSTATSSAPAVKDPLASTWSTRSGWSARTARTGSSIPAGLDLQPHPGRAGLHDGVDLLAQRGDVVAVGDPHHGARPPGPRTPRPTPRSSASERPVARSSASATAISKVAASMRSTGELPKSCDTSASVGSSPAPGRCRLAEAGHARSAAARSTSPQGRVDRGALGRGRRTRPSPRPPRRRPARRAADAIRCTPAAVPMAWRNGRSTWTSSTPASFMAGALPPRHRRSQLVRSSVLARMAEWQTRRPQKPLSERACGFESRSGHVVLSRTASGPIAGFAAVASL